MLVEVVFCSRVLDILVDLRSLGVKLGPVRVQFEDECVRVFGLN